MTNLPFEIQDDGWVEALPAAQASAIQDLLATGKTEEQIAEMWLSQAGAQNNVGFGSGGALQSYFANVRAEFAAFVCGDAKYEKERAEALALWNGGKLTVVTAVAGVIATSAGLAAVAVVPVVALLFSVAGKIGIAAFCNQCSASGDAVAG